MRAEPSRSAHGLRGGLLRASIGVVLLASLAIVAAVPAGAQSTPSNAFRNGEAQASADTFTLNIVQGNANIGFTYGRTIADYRDRTGSADARALDLGVLPTLFATEQCDGSTPPMNPDTLPPDTRVDSTTPNADRSRRVEVFVPGHDGGPAGPSAGFQDAKATARPTSWAATESVDTDILLLAMDGGRTEVRTQLQDGVREAHAVSTADELRILGGLITLENPRWEAVARSGGATTAEGDFTFERATLLGIPRTREEALRDLAGFGKGIEDLLKFLGVKFDVPTVVVEEGRVTVTPMVLRLVDPPIGRDLLAPFLGAIQPLREERWRELVEQDCTNALTITLIDILLGVASGSGALEVRAGGVDVWTADTDFSAPPLEPLPGATPPPAPAPPPPLEPLPDLVDPVPFDPEPLDAGFEALPVETVPPAADPGPVAEVAAATRERASVAVAAPALPSTRFEDSGGGAAAVAVGVAGLLGAIVLSFGERLWSRRTARRIP